MCIVMKQLEGGNLATVDVFFCFVFDSLHRERMMHRSDVSLFSDASLFIGAVCYCCSNEGANAVNFPKK